MKHAGDAGGVGRQGRSPQGERGLKLGHEQPRGVQKRRSPQGERGLKRYRGVCWGRSLAGRSPQGERGLKLTGTIAPDVPEMSLPARGAWVETGLSTACASQLIVAPRKGSVG